MERKDNFLRLKTSLRPKQKWAFGHKSGFIEKNAHSKSVGKAQKKWAFGHF
jgi:hypothetical protein